MTTWKEFDAFVEQDLASTNTDSGMLRAHLTVLLVKRLVSYQTPVKEIQHALYVRYDVEYEPAQISDELLCMWHEEEYEANKHVLIKEEPE